MKIRSGFVSNSSSSSFIIYGIKKYFDFKEFKERNLVKSEHKKMMENYESNTVIDYVRQQLPKQLKIYYNYENDRVYIGSDPREMKEEETCHDFKQWTSMLISQIFGEEAKCDWILETVEM